VRHTFLGVAADAHGFTGDIVGPSSPTKLFKLVVALPSTKEPRFVKPSVSCECLLLTLGSTAYPWMYCV
jgi:hypothetical protein